MIWITGVLALVLLFALGDGAMTLAEVRVELRGERPARDGATRADRFRTEGGSFTARLDSAAMLAATPGPVVRDVAIGPARAALPPP